MGENHWGWNVNATYKGYGLGYGQTYYGNAIGPDGIPNKQTVGSATGYFPGGSVNLQNDFLAGNGDRWRSNGLEITIGDFSIGNTIYTNDGKTASGKEADKIKNIASPLWGHHRREGKGAWKNGQVYSSPLWFGYRVGNHVSRIGYSHRVFQDATQNFVHTHGFMFLPFGFQNYYLDYDNFKQGMYYYSGYYNPYSLWGK